MTLRRTSRLSGLIIATLLAAPACGGTLEGKYRRGELTTTTTRASRSTGTGPGTAVTTSTTTTAPTRGNAAGQHAESERERPAPGGTIVESAAWRLVAPPLGGRHR